MSLMLFVPEGCQHQSRGWDKLMEFRRLRKGRVYYAMDTVQGWPVRLPFMLRVLNCGGSAAKVEI